MFKVHKNTVKGGHKISLDLARKLSMQNLECVPGWQLCRRCYGMAQCNEQPTAFDIEPSYIQISDTVDADISEIESSVSQSEKRSNLNRSLETMDISPIKTHSMPKHRRVSYATSKLEKTVDRFKKSFAAAANIEEWHLPSIQERKNENISESIRVKANDLEKLTEKIKEKLQNSTLNNREKVQILTLTPESWTVAYASSFFGVSEYLVRQSREIGASCGILAMPEKKTGSRTLQKSAIDLVTSFFQDDEFSRLMPGMKDSVSVGKNKHEQKRLLLCNIKELYALFKQHHPDVTIGFSKFCSLRPKWCVTVGASGTHTVCVCILHQNAILMVQAATLDLDYKDMIDKIVCSRESRTCMIHRCNECPGKEALRSQVEAALTNKDNICFQQWQTTDRTKMFTQTMPVGEFVEKLLETIDALTPHSYIAKCQANYLKARKKKITEETAIVLGDFAENYTFTVQDEVQSYHWSRPYCTLHPVVLYYKQNAELLNRSFCFLSDDLEHDTNFVFEVQRRLTSIIKIELPSITKVEYFSDGCAAQYKNYKNMMNLCSHKDDFGLDATWSFFATSHGKSSCDGIGGTVKRLTSRASLQRPSSDQILDVTKMLEFCEGNIQNIQTLFISKERMENVRKELMDRFSLGRTIPGTRSYHYFEPVSTSTIAFKYTAEEDTFLGTFNISGEKGKFLSITSAKASDFVACRYDKKWWIGMVKEFCMEENDFKISFLHPPGPCLSFHWPQREDVCWVSELDVLSSIEAPVTKTGRTYDITNEDVQNINELLLNHNKPLKLVP